MPHSADRPGYGRGAYAQHQKLLGVERERLLVAGFGRVASTGYSEAEWVARWTERPDLLSDLLVALFAPSPCKAIRTTNAEREAVA